jgi:hypothetical protein
VYEGKKFKNTSKKLYYPGEVILSNIPVKKLSFCEHFWENTEQLLVRPVEIYEFPHSDLHKLNVQSRLNKDSNIELETKAIYLINLIKLLKVLKI